MTPERPTMPGLLAGLDTPLTTGVNRSMIWSGPAEASKSGVLDEDDVCTPTQVIGSRCQSRKYTTVPSIEIGLPLTLT
jgi:hypothetical protein